MKPLIKSLVVCTLIFLPTKEVLAFSELCQIVDQEIPLIVDIETPKVSKIVVSKKSRLVLLFQGDQVVRVFPAVFGKNIEGHKVKEGDRRTPEGIYFIEAKNPRSEFHMALRISYPNRSDRQRARALGVSAGGDIMIHGTPTVTENRKKESKRIMIEELHSLGLNWTNGCIAVSNEAIEEIYARVQVGTPIEICPL